MPIAFALLVGAGCMKSPSGTLGQADSQSAGEALGNGIENGATTFGPMNTVSSVVALNPCVTLSGDTSDTDQDNIPTNATLTYNCSATSLGLTGTLTGTLMVMDTQPTEPAWAFSAAADLHTSLTGSGGASLDSDRVGALTATQAAATGPFDLAYSLLVESVLMTAVSDATISEQTGWTLEYTPQVTWTPGSVVVGGTLTATGSWDVTVNNNSATATLATPTALTITPSCATRVTGGTVTASYATAALMHTLTVSWTGCGQRTVTYSER